ncbi:MAG: hypothetical protein HUJ98_04115 [Bacteroidaceae bacterium]|nr:hypothetical protein [Bacteroidaceae bacterium]
MDLMLVLQEEIAQCDADKAAKQASYARLESEYAEIVNSENELASYKNSFEQFFDGVKFANTKETAIAIAKFPMIVMPNLWYKHNGKYYICVVKKTLKSADDVNQTNFEEMS